MDTTGDPGKATLLNGLHLLHRSTINFAEVPVVSDIDAFMIMKGESQAYVRKETLCSNPHA